jgi:hypothetical protein
MDRRNSSGRTPTANGDNLSVENPDSSPAPSSVEPPPSLDPYLSEPTTHAKIGDPDSDEEGEDEEAKAASRVQERDFGAVDETGKPRPVDNTRNEQNEEDSMETHSRSTSSASSRPLILTSRFEHQVTEGGEILILTGREGQLMTCEDEVSRTILLSTFFLQPVLILFFLSFLSSLFTLLELFKLSEFSSLSNKKKMIVSSFGRCQR